MIKNNPLGVTLVFALFLSALATSWFAVWWYLGARELQSLEYQYQAMTQTSTAIQALANDAVEFGRHNPSIDSLLQQFDLKPRPAGAPPAGQPTSKPTR